MAWNHTENPSSPTTHCSQQSKDCISIRLLRWDGRKIQSGRRAWNQR